MIVRAARRALLSFDDAKVQHFKERLADSDRQRRKKREIFFDHELIE